MSQKLDHVLGSFLRSSDNLLPGHWILALAFAALLVLVLSLPRANRRASGLSIALLTVPLTFTLARSVVTPFLVDQALVDFRYAHNLARGFGPVFNPGERVNGCSSLLWVLLLALPDRIGIPLPVFAAGVSLLSVPLILLVVANYSRIMTPRDNGQWFSIALCLLAASSLFTRYTTSGLPTTLAALFALLSFRRLSTQPVRSGIGAAIAGLFDIRCLVLVIVQPLGMWRTSQKWPASKYLVGAGSLLVPFLSWSWFYYREPLPLFVYSNNYAEAHFDQGFTYLLVALFNHGLWALIPAVIVGCFVATRSAVSRTAIASGAAYLAIVIWTGGDKYDGHLLVLLLPGIALAAEQGLRAAWAARHRGWSLALTVPVAALILPVQVLGRHCNGYEIVDPACYDRPERVGLETTRHCESIAEAVRGTFANFRPIVTLATTCPGTIAHRTDEQTVDLSGNLDRHLAHHQFDGYTGRVRHDEDHAAYLYERGVDLSEVPIWPSQFARLSTVNFGSTTFFLGRYRQPVIDRISSSPAAHVPHLGGYVSTYTSEANEFSKNCDRWFLEAFYFAYDHQTERMPFLDRLGLSPRVKSFYGFGGVERMSEWEVVRTLELVNTADQPWLQTGQAFADWPTRGAVVNQADLSQPLEWMINTFHARPAHEDLGRLQSPEFEIVGDVISMRIGGSKNENAVYAGLLIDGQMVRKAAGCDSNILDRQVWDVTPYKGRRARLLMVDNDASGFLVVGDIKQWRYMPEKAMTW